MQLKEVSDKINALHEANPDVALRVTIQRTTVRVSGWGRADAQVNRELTFTELDADPASLDRAFQEVIEHLR